MPTTTDHPPAEDTAAGAPGRATLGSKISAFAIVVASIATLVILFMMLRSANDESPRVVQAIPAEPETAAPSQAPPPEASAAAPLPPPAPARTPEVRAAPVEPAPPPQPTQPAQAEAPVIDELGFVDSDARCEDGQTAVAIARTQASAVVVCRDEDGDYAYHGVRLRDGASLTLDDVRPMPAGFEARNGSTTYRLSATELVVIDGETLYTREPVVEYQAG